MDIFYDSKKPLKTLLCVFCDLCGFISYYMFFKLSYRLNHRVHGGIQRLRIL